MQRKPAQNLLIRNRSLYPAELRARSLKVITKSPRLAAGIIEPLGSRNVRSQKRDDVAMEAGSEAFDAMFDSSFEPQFSILTGSLAIPLTVDISIQCRS
jgi:hypothetical protein